MQIDLHHATVCIVTHFNDSKKAEASDICHDQSVRRYKPSLYLPQMMRDHSCIAGVA